LSGRKQSSAKLNHSRFRSMCRLVFLSFAYLNLSCGENFRSWLFWQINFSIAESCSRWKFRVNNNFYLDFTRRKLYAKILGVKRRRRLKKNDFFFYQLTGIFSIQH
jgi:hypothetical protein